MQTSTPKPKTPFYKATWFIVLMLLFIFPVGAILLWAFGRPKQVSKIILTVVFGLLFIIIIVPKGGDDATVSGSASPVNTTMLQASTQPTEAIESATVASTETPTLEPTVEPTLEPTPTPTPEPTETPFDPSTIAKIKKSGKGDDVISLEAKNVWVYRCIATHSGKGNFVIKVDGDLMVNEIGKYTGSFPLSYDDLTAKEFEITANGNWTLTLEPLLFTTTSEASGKGDYVSNVFTSDGPGVYEIKHEGKSNFVVKIHGVNGDELLVNEIGDYSGKKKVDVNAGDIAFWEIIADGSWTIKKSD